MSRLHAIALVALLCACATTPASAAPMNFDGHEDIGALLAEARRTWDFAGQDAVVLVEGARFTWLADGRLREEHHRVVWVGTDFGGDHYADLRVPWDSDRQSFAVKALRVWRDGRWIEHRPTAIVETTPFAFRTTPDYTGIRETMLLHDGVELPCILECAYVIEDKVAYREGFDGRRVFAQADPTLESRIIVAAPAGAGLAVQAPDQASRLRRAEEEAPAGYEVHAYGMHKLEPAPEPAGPEPASYLPHVTWSTFPSRERLGAALRKIFDDNSALDGALRDSLEVLRTAALSRADLACRVADFVKRSQRRVGYDQSLMWAQARPAGRVYDTGYGADLDLAILAGALFKAAGFESVGPVFLARGFAPLPDAPPTLAGYDLRGVLVRDGGTDLLYDVASGTLQGGLWHRGFPVWAPGLDLAVERSPAGRATVALDLRPDKEGERWTAEGVFETTGFLNPFAAQTVNATDTGDRVEKLAFALVESLMVADYGLAEFGPKRLAVRLKGSAAMKKPDDAGRIAVVIGDPPGGLRASLPADVHLYQTERGTPVQFPGPLEQTVTVKLHPGKLEVVRLPEPVEITNPAGSFRLAVEQKGDEVTVSRTTRLAKATYSAQEWPALRELLLAEGDAGNRTVLLK